MKMKFLRLLAATALLAGIQRAAAQGTAFTYQGQLDNGTNTVNGTFDLTFALYNAGSGGSQAGSTVTNLGVGVTNGLFTVTNDFGAVFNGTSYWLQIGVRTNGASTFSPLTPRQAVTPTPYAVYAESAGSNALIGDPGTQNFFAGQLAGSQTLTGTHNTGVGYGSLGGITTGVYNTAMGDSSLLYDTTGGGNTAGGVYALWKNTTGNNNTAFGADAMAYNTTAANNAAFGQAALENNTVGSNNVAVGTVALLNNTSDNGAVAIGYGALQNDTFTPGFFGSSGSVAVGYEALQLMNTGAFNTAVGYQALEEVTSGLGNIGIGINAGYNLTTGNYNIDIGTQGDSGDTGIIRIGTYGTQTETYISGALQMDGIDTNNGLVFVPSGLPGISYDGQGMFLFGYYGGALGAVLPNTVCLSWDSGGDVWVSNNFSTATLTIRGGSDLAEPFKINSNNREVPEGAVVVIDDANPGQLKMTDRAYDTHVAGVISGANGINPGIEMHQDGVLEGGKNVALSGRVYVQADTSNGPIKPGDLLTTSKSPGRAMRVTNHSKAQGAILGKAMTGLSEGDGMVLVLVTLQ